MLRTRDRSRMTRSQKAWDTANRGNYRPWPAGLSQTQRQARQLHSLYSHVLTTYCNPQAAANYEGLTGQDEISSIATQLRTILQKLEALK